MFFSRKSGSNCKRQQRQEDSTRPTERGCEEHGDGNAHGVHREEVQNGIHPVEDMGQRDRVQRPPSNRDSNHVVPSGPSGQSGYCQLHGEGGGSIAWAHKKAFVPPPTGDMTDHVVTNPYKNSHEFLNSHENLMRFSWENDILMRIFQFSWESLTRFFAHENLIFLMRTESS